MSSKFGGTVTTPSTQSIPKRKTGLTTIPASNKISVAVKPFHVFGVRGNVRDNIDYLSESRLIYPVGKKICTYMLEKKRTEFIGLQPDVEHIIGLSVAPNRKRVAICELSSTDVVPRASSNESKSGGDGSGSGSGGGGGGGGGKQELEDEGAKSSQKSPRGGLNPLGLKSQVSVYHALQGVHLRTLSLSGMKGCFVNCAFTGDNKFLVAVGSEPDFKLVYWKWSNMKMISSVSMSSEVTRVRVNPNNPSQVTTTGPQHAKLWTLEKDLTLKCSSLMPQKKEKSEIFVDHAWTKMGASSDGGLGESGFILLATETGTIQVVRLNEEGQPESRQTINLFAGHKSHGAGGGSSSGGSSSSGGGGSNHHLHHHQKIQTIQAYAKGFVVGGSHGYFAVYEQTDDQKDPFLPIRSFETGEHDIINSLAISPLGETVTSFILPSMQLKTFPLAHIDMIEQDGSEKPFTMMRQNGFHAGAILDMSVCLCRPCIATVGMDHTIRIWNYLTWECEILFDTGSEDGPPMSISLHPSGFHLVVGFKERVRMYNILRDTVKELRSMPIKNCRELKFNNGGNMFAAGECF